MQELTKERWEELKYVQKAVNSRVGYTSDAALYGKAEFWEIAQSAGDCEDFALAKRQLLMGLAWPWAALRLAVCELETGERHAVLTVDTLSGTYVLDNLQPAPVPWKALPYNWIMRQDAGTTAWVEVKAEEGNIQ